jgi:hypothetical protein
VWISIHTFTPLQTAHAGPMSTHFSKPFTTRKQQHSTMAPRPSRDMPEPARGRRLTVVNEQDSFSGSNGTAATTHVPLNHVDFHFSSGAGSSESSPVPDTEYRGPEAFYGSHYSSSNSSSHSLQVPSLHTSRKARYYPSALSEQDKEALVHGELNHNLKEYTPKDVVMHHESRKALVPQGHGVNKLHNMEALANIERQKQHSQQALNKKVRGSVILPSFRLTNESGKDDRITYHQQATQSMCDLRSPSAPPAPQHPSNAPPSPPPPTLSRKFSFDTASPPAFQSSHVRAASNGDYFSRHTRIPHTQLPSPPSSGSSSRVRSPLVQEVPRHRHNPSATFDSFLVPHKSGKGEVFRDSPSAKKDKGSADAGTSALEHGQSSLKDKKHGRRFSKVPSMISLKKRASQRDLGKACADDVPDVPSLP